MATRAKRTSEDPGFTGKRRRNNQCDEAQLKILRLDLHTLLAQIKMLEHELCVDPCLSTKGVSTVLSLVDALKQELEGVKHRIRQLKGVTTAHGELAHQHKGS
jgi:hypothetical protein